MRPDLVVLRDVFPGLADACITNRRAIHAKLAGPKCRWLVALPNFAHKGISQLRVLHPLTGTSQAACQCSTDILAARHGFQVDDSVVALVAVEVVDFLAAPQVAVHGLPNHPMRVLLRPSGLLAQSHIAIAACGSDRLACASQHLAANRVNEVAALNVHRQAGDLRSTAGTDGKPAGKRIAGRRGFRYWIGALVCHVPSLGLLYTTRRQHADCLSGTAAASLLISWVPMVGRQA